MYSARLVNGNFGLRASLPNRRLTSKAVGNRLKSRIVNDIVIENGLNVITSRLVWRTDNDQQAKRLIVTKRNQCDALIAKNESVLFFVSCLTSMDSSKRKKRTPVNPDDDNNASEAHSDSSEEDEPVKIYPGINYWIAHSAIPGLDLQTSLHGDLLQSDLDITEVKPIRSRGKQSLEDSFAATLQTCVKDHNNAYVRDVLKKSIEHCSTELVRIMVVNESVPEYGVDNFSSKDRVLRIVVCHTSYKPKIDLAVKELRDLGCEIQVGKHC